MREDSQRGIVLVTALWVVMLLALFAFVVVETTRAERHIGRNVAEQARLQAVAEAGVARAIMAMLDRQTATPWPIDGTSVTFSYAGVDLTVAIEDEFGKVDLNAATGEMLARLFAAAGSSDHEAKSLADAVEDWRDKDDLRHANGAERDDYRKDDRPYGPRNAALERTAEILQVKGMTADLFARVRPVLTVHSMRQFVDPMTAAPGALAAIRGDRADVARPEAGNTPLSATARSIVSLAGRAFTIRVSARKDDGSATQRRTIVRFTDDAARPYWIQSWDTDP
jgi:general secretion pathway protein K